MANRYMNQFAYSFEQKPVHLMGSFAQSGSTGTFATLASGSITYTAKTMGTGGNFIKIALVAGGTAGAEVVTVSAQAGGFTLISVSIESAVSTRSQVKTAIDASAAAAALVSVSVSSGGTAATLLAATALATGTSTAFTAVAKGMSLVQIGTGVFKIVLADSYPNLLAANISIQDSVADDIMTQIQSASPSSSSAPNVQFRVQAGATPTNLASGDAVYVHLILRNSGA